MRRRLSQQSTWRKPITYIIAAVALAIVILLLYQIPSVKARADFYSTTARARVYYFFNPPGKEVFVPGEDDGTSQQAIQTLTAMAPTATVTSTITLTPTNTATAEFTATPTMVPTKTPMPTPLPKSALVEGVVQVYQGFNNCGPANLSMILNFWGWEGDQKTTEAVLKPFIKDRNVMPYEMLGYVQEHTELNGVVRYGGTLDLVKQLVASGFPVVIERGYIDRHEGWMGHYGLIIGYDDATQEVTIPDTYLGMIKMSYDEVDKYWAQFDKIYLVVFPTDRAEEVYNILGPQMDADYNKQSTFETIQANLYNNKDVELFFAWYSRGSILVELNDFWGAAESYDEAFKVYATLEEEERPWRMLWYQTGPYYAYYNMQRYWDLHDLAEQTLAKTPEDAIPETWVWKGRAEVKLGLRDEAIASFKQALYWHPGWWVAENELIALGEPVN